MADKKFPSEFTDRGDPVDGDKFMIYNSSTGASDEYVTYANLMKETDTALGTKADKVSGATNGNFAGLDANGNLTDSGKKTADFEPADNTILKDADIADNLTTETKGSVLDASQGKILDDAKADKVSGAVNGNFAGLDTNGNITDSGSKAADFEPADATILKDADIANNLTTEVAGSVLDATQGKALNDGKIDKTAVKQTTGTSTDDVMSQKAITDELALKADITYVGEKEDEAIDRTFKTMRIGATGLVTLSPTTSYFTYRLGVTGNITLTIDLQRMIEQVGNARCRLIIDMPILKTITFTNPILWGGTIPTFASAGQYILEVIDVDGSGTPLVWLVASTTKAQTTGNILYVDSTGADYTVAQINGETATRTTSTWVAPFKYLQNAINAAQAGDIIFVKEGIYKPTHLRTSPTTYTDGDHLLRDATFTPKNGVDIYGGFVGTETKTWQRVMDANGYPVNQTILCGDILGEATVDPAKTVGDTRTDASKANAAYNVVFGKAISALTYLNGVNMRYGNASDATGDQSVGGGINSAALLIGINNTAYSNTATTYAGGWYLGTNTNCTAYSNTAATYGGGWRGGTNTNCTSYNNTATSGGGWIYGTNTNCTAYGNTASNGGGWNIGTNTNCTAYSNTATTNGGGWY